MNYSQQSGAPVQRTHQYGLRPMLIGSEHCCGRPDGAEAFLSAHDRAKFAKAAAAAPFVCMHPTCAGKTWPNIDEMIAAHPSYEVMEKHQEKHTYGQFSKEPADPVALAKAEKSGDKDGAAAERAKIVGFLSDVRPDVR